MNFQCCAFAFMLRALTNRMSERQRSTHRVGKRWSQEQRRVGFILRIGRYPSQGFLWWRHRERLD